MAAKSKTRTRSKASREKASSSRSNRYEKLREKWSQGGNANQFWRLDKPGRAIIRPFFFVAPDGEEMVMVPSTTHWNLSPEMKRATCPGEDCPICAVGHKIDADLWRGLNGIGPQTRYLCNILLPREDNRHVIAQFTPFVADAIRKYVVPEEGAEDYVEGCLEAEGGHNFILIRTDKGKRVTYEIRIETEASDVELPEGLDLFSRIPAPPPMEELKKIARSFT